MNCRITKAFRDKKSGLLSIYFTAGFPELQDGPAILKNLELSGADIVEVGIPFSDPLADGPVIQKSNERALRNGMSIRVLFDQFKGFRKSVRIPVILMTYFNPVMQFGIDSFITEAAQIGFDGVIIPDLPLEEYIKIRKYFKKHKFKNIFVFPIQADEDRIRKMDSLSDAFLYLVTSPSITGSKKFDAIAFREQFKEIKKLQLKNPILGGFGISDAEAFREVSFVADGAVIGSAFIDALEKRGSGEEVVRDFIHSILQNN